jgi:hypothetical protein
MHGLAQGASTGNAENVAVAIRSPENIEKPGRFIVAIGNQQQIEGLAEGGTGRHGRCELGDPRVYSGSAPL